MDRDSVEWKGFFCAPTTPFDETGELDDEAWRALIHLLVGFGVHGLVVGSTTGEWYSMSDRERVQLAQVAVEEVDGRVPVIAGAHAFTPTAVIELGRAYAEAGVDGIILPPPSYVLPRADEIYEFYRAVSESLELPIMIYNIPPHSGVDIDLKLCERLANIETVVAIKDSTLDRGAFYAKLPILVERLRVFSAFMNPVGYAALRMVGGDGWICPGALSGSQLPQYFDAFWREDDAEALRLAKRWMELAQQIYGPKYSSPLGSTPAVLKAAMNMMNQPGGYVRPPLLPLTPDAIRRLGDVLRGAGLVGADGESESLAGSAPTPAL